MIRVLQVNIVCNSGSTGRIAEEIGCLVIKSGLECYIGYGRGDRPSNSYSIRIGSDFNLYTHGVQSRFFDNHGLASRKATISFVESIKKINPGIIHLHNIHGYYLNYPILFDCLKELDIPIIWTLHDCWPFTGHCAYFTAAECDKWKTGCYECPNKKEYPASYFLDNSNRNYQLKKKVFTSNKNIHFVPVSSWLSELLDDSFFSDYPKTIIHNGVDLDIFKPIKSISSKSSQFIVLGVASVWDKRKGLDDFIKLRQILDSHYSIIVVGVSKKQMKSIPDGIVGIERTENIQQLAELYSKADVFLNPTYEDNFPTTNIEALACGTPVITYNTGGSPEAVTTETGFVVEQGNIQGLVDCINIVKDKGKDHYAAACRERAVKHFNKDDRYQEYIDLYKSLLNKK